MNEVKSTEGPLTTIKSQLAWQKPVSVSAKFQNCVDSAMEERLRNLESHVGVIKPGMYFIARIKKVKLENFL